MIRAINHTQHDVATRIVAIQQAAYAVEAELMGFDGIPPLHEQVADVQALRDLIWMAAFIDSEMVGVIAWFDHGDSIEIDRLAIDPASSRLGHGRELVRSVPRTPVVDVSTGSLNLPAVALYESEGFLQVGTTEVAPLVFTSQFRRDTVQTEKGELLAGGNLNAGVVRIGATVHREAGPWTPAVHDLLAHLERRAFPAPQPFGLDERGREVLSYIPGDPIYPNNLDLIDSPEAMLRVGGLIAAYHAAQSDFESPTAAIWRTEGRDPTGSTEVLAHNDLSPWNLIVGPRGWIFIDWDLVAPGRRMWDLAWALHSFVGLWPDSHHNDREIVDRIVAFCKGASVENKDRQLLLETVIERTEQHAIFLRSQAEAGHSNYRRMVDEGHADRWEQGSRHVAANLGHWIALMGTQ